MSNKQKRFKAAGDIVKVDDTLGIVFKVGRSSQRAIISKIKGEPYFDTQGDHIPEDAMLKATVSFMASDPVLGDMHKEAEGGTIIFAFPMTEEIAKSYGITTDQTGLMIGAKPENPETLAKFKDGTYTGFSIGGRVGVAEEVE